MAAMHDDFGDDEDFGLGGGGESRSLQVHDSSGDIYGDPENRDTGGADDFSSIYPGRQTSDTTTLTLNAQPGPPASRGVGAAGNQSTVEAHNAGLEAHVPAEEALNQQRSATHSAAGTSTTVYVGNLQWWTTDAEVEMLCGQYGTVDSVRFFEERSNGKSKGYCLVEFTDAASAAQCKSNLHGQSINDKDCVVTFATVGQSASAPGPTSASRYQGGRHQDDWRDGPRPQGGRGQGRGYRPMEDTQVAHPPGGLNQGRGIVAAPMGMPIPGAMMPPLGPPRMGGMGPAGPMGPMGVGSMGVGGMGPMGHMGPFMPPGMGMPGMPLPGMPFPGGPRSFAGPYFKRPRY